MCLKASKLGMLKSSTSKADDAFSVRGYSNWKDAVGIKGGFSTHERMNVHKHSVELVTKAHGDVGEMLSAEIAGEKSRNRAYLKKVLENIVFLARQGLPFRGSWVSGGDESETGNELNSNFHQLLLLRSIDDATILDYMQRKKQKYTDHHIQNEFLKILALGHMRSIAADINRSGFFTLEADEVTDTSNKEQVIVWLMINFKLTKTSLVYTMLKTLRQTQLFMY